jgi:Tol biopolymer transport system component
VIFAVIGGTAVAAWFIGSTTAVRASTPVAPVSFTQEPPEGTALLPDLAVSPDGRVLAFVAQSTTTRESHLWVRELVSGEVRRLEGSAGATQPFWSPDSSAMGFFAKGQLKIVELTGRAPRTIATVGVLPQGGAWGANDVILFAPWMSGLYAVPVAAGTPRPVTALDREFDERAHRHPQFLEDGVHFLFDVTSAKRGGTFVGSMEDPGRTQLLDAPVSHVMFVRPDRLFSFRDGTLTTARLDSQRRVVGSAPARLLTPLVPPAFGARSGFSVSQAGVLAFGGGRTVEQFIAFTRDGRKTGLMRDVPTLNPAISPDERYLAATGRDSMAGLWLLDIERGASTRVVQDGSWPAWSPTGEMLVYSAPRVDGIADLYVRTIAMTGAADEKLLLQTSESKIVQDWSRDGRYIVFASRNPQMKHDLWLLPMAGDRKPIPYLQTSFSQQQAQVSPDGRWLAYSSDESGTWEVYLQSFPVPGGKRTISVGGGGEPKWRADGRELFYVRPDHTLMAVEIPGGDPTKGVGAPQPLFSVPLNGDTGNFRSRYMVLSNGTRFLFYALDDTTEAPITVLVNWPALLPN